LVIEGVDHERSLETMLKPLTQPRSPASPNFHYAPVSQSLPTSPLSRRNSARSQAQINIQSPVQKVAPPPSLPRVRYADASTQWESPVMNLKKELADGESISAKPEQKIAVVADVEPSKEGQPKIHEKPLLEPQSPSSKRRQSLTGTSTVVGSSHNVAPKRARAAQTAVKILPIKYEFCEVEDMVILIADSNK
jgi:hypothetical protein